MPDSPYWLVEGAVEAGTICLCCAEKETSHEQANVLGAVACVSFATIALAAGPRGDDDIAAIKKSSADFQTAWNKHDPKVIAAFWASDGDLIDPWGKTAVGRAAVESFLMGEHTGKSTYDLKKDTVRLISPDVAVEDWEVVLTGVIPPDATAPLGPQFHRVVIVRKKDGGQWLVAAARPGLLEPVTKPGAPKNP